MERKIETDAQGLNAEDWKHNGDSHTHSNGVTFNEQSTETHVFYIFAQESRDEDITNAMEWDILSFASTMKTRGYWCKRIKIKNNYEDMRLKLNAVSQLNHKNVSSFVCAMFLNHESAWYAKQEKSILNCVTTPFNVRNSSSLAGTPKIFIIQLYPRKVVHHARNEDTVDSFKKKKEKVWIPLEADFLILHSIATYADLGGSHFGKAFCKSLSIWGGNVDVVHLLTKVNSLTLVNKSTNGNNDHIVVPSIFCRLRESHLLSKNVQKTTICKASDNLQFRKYDMATGKRGIFMIFNNKTFSGDGVKDRPGTNRDRDNLEETMGKLGFQCKVYNNLEKAKIEEKLLKISNLDHSKYACLGCAILTHGGDDDTLLSSDNKTLTLNDFTEPFTTARCPTLNGKPKLFFLQVCRGYNYDVGNKIHEKYYPVTISESDYETETNSIDTEKDFLISQSTTSDYYSWRDSKNGSLFIRDLCETINARAKKQELLTMLTEVNQKVAHHNIAFRDEFGTKHNYKQMPCFGSRLTGEIYFYNKKKQFKETLEQKCATIHNSSI